MIYLHRLTLNYHEDKYVLFGSDAVFKHTEALQWTDARNWDSWNKATPDLERVPCTNEAVRFLPGATYNILTPGIVQVGSLELHGVVSWILITFFGVAPVAIFFGSLFNPG